MGIAQVKDNPSECRIWISDFSNFLFILVMEDYMKKLFYVFLISSFSLGLVSCAKTYSKISKSKTIDTVFENSESSGSTIENSTIEDSSVKH